MRATRVRQQCFHPLARKLTGLAFAVFATLAIAQQGPGGYPNKAVRVVLPAAPGSLTDPVGRIVTEELAKRTGQPWVIENRPGAGGIIGSDNVAKSAPDGYSLLFTANNFIITPALYSGTVPYKVQEDFTPIGLAARADNLLVASRASGINSIQELVAAAKKAPKGLDYTSPLLGSAAHLTVELFKRVAGIPLNHVAYKDASQGTTDTLSGQIAVNIMGVSTALPHIQAGKLAPLAWTGEKRLASLPNTPTFVEAGFREVHMGLWFGYFGPAKMPAPLVSYINEQLNAALRSAAVTERLGKLTIETLPGTPATLAETLKRETPVYARIAADTGLKLD
ncbi:MAG: Bug family tripartite tricarboxylate transporter substrate binding protein [Burkholderiales bacterium]